MAEISQTDEKKGDEVLRRLLKTPPEPKTGKSPSPRKTEKEKDDNG